MKKKEKRKNKIKGNNITDSFINLSNKKNKKTVIKGNNIAGSFINFGVISNNDNDDDDGAGNMVRIHSKGVDNE